MKAPASIRRLARRLVQHAGYSLLPAERLGLDALNDVAYLCRPSLPEVIFDVGAHEGETYVDLRRRFPTASIYCFEPYTAAFKTLAARLAADPAARAFRLALGDRNGPATLHCHRRSHWNSLLPDAPTLAALVPAELVTRVGDELCEVQRLDDFCALHAVTRIDLLKLDVQGFELRVLAGSRALLQGHRIRMIYTEVAFAPYYDGQCFFRDLLDFLDPLGYRLVALYYLDHGRAPNGLLRWCDALFLAEDIQQ